MARKKKSKRTRKSSPKARAPHHKSKKKVRRRGRPRGLAGVPVAQLQAELERREQLLLDQRHELQQQLDAIDSELAALGRPSPRSSRPQTAARKSRTTLRRRQGKASLADSLHAVLQGKTMGVSEVTDAVQRAGYKTRSANFRTIVNATLLQHTDRFKKVARGRYTAK